jgi:hypothetical protein
MKLLHQRNGSLQEEIPVETGGASPPPGALFYFRRKPNGD